MDFDEIIAHADATRGKMLEDVAAMDVDELDYLLDDQPDPVTDGVEPDERRVLFPRLRSFFLRLWGRLRGTF